VRAIRRGSGEAGYMMAALLVAMSVMAVALSVLVPVWSTMAKREREAELVFRGEQYARAIARFQRKYANALPPNVDVLVNERFLRKKYKDPITGGDFQLLAAGTVALGQGTPAGAARGVPNTGGSSQNLPAAGGGRGQASPQAQAVLQLQQAARALQAARGQTPRGAQQTVGAGAPAAGGIMGVASTSTERSLRVYNGRDRYNEWTFLALQMTMQAGGAGAQTPGGRGSAAGRGAGARGAAGPAGRAGGDGRGGPTGGREGPPPRGGFNQRGR
jgi:type II secretory pathway pseudopilin PulG